MRGWRAFIGRIFATSLVFGTFLVAFPEPASAATINVTTTADDYNFDPGTCSLREAITAANTDAAFGGCPAGSGTDTINLQAATYVLDESGPPENANVSGDLDILATVTINGPAQRAIVDANDIDRVFHVEPGGCCVTMNRLIVQDGTIAGFGGGIRGSSLTFTNGAIRDNTADEGGGAYVSFSTFVNSAIEDNDAGSGGGLSTGEGDITLVSTSVDGNDATADGSSGGGILVREEVTLIDSAVTFNTTQGMGGGIAAPDAGFVGDEYMLSLTRTWVSNNSADDGGGGIVTEANDTEGEIRVANSVISDNSGDLDGTGPGLGGGILNDVDAGSPDVPPNLVLSDTTVSGNRAVDGDGIFNLGSMTLTNVTMSGNGNASGSGGGIANYTHSDADLSSVTFENNTAASGGHIWNVGNMTVTNTLMGDDAAGGHCTGTLPTSAGPNMEANDLDDCGFTMVPDVVIGPLQDNGGPRLMNASAPRTHALLAGSPAIDAGSGGPPTDQRGVPRPQGAAPDLGAYERAFCQGVLVNEVGTDGDDSITGSTEIDGVLALGGDDLVHGLEGNDHVCGGDGDDELWGGDPFTVGDGQDLLLGAAGNDTLRGGDSADDLQGAGGGDRLLGGAGADDGSGGAGADNVLGNAGNDDLFGNGGPDRLAGGPDNDDCNGGPGTDSSTGCEDRSGIP